MSKDHDIDLPRNQASSPEGGSLSSGIDLGATEEMPVVSPRSLGATEEMPVPPPISSRSRMRSGAPPSQPIQLVSGQSSGESQAAYASQGPHAIPPSRNAAVPEAPAVIVDGGPSHTYEPFQPPRASSPPPSSRGGLYAASPPPPPSGPIPQMPYLPPVGLASSPQLPRSAPVRGTLPLGPPLGHLAGLPAMRATVRSETVVIPLPARGPSSGQKLAAFALVLLLVAFVGIVLLMWRGPHLSSAAPPEAIEPQALPVPEPSPTPSVVVPPPAIAVVATPAMAVDAGAKPRKPRAPKKLTP